ncbi:glycoside hydrolase family 3 protein [Aaosphaeria arxii CBS 175.79]|uniref:beta-glucosidase n=1 Tax=Aaosphaeria arxii CBS 175.79 TaxID=1450172 RepID=A0A6A5XNP8_9PLEO|nr:glycoside hydrolase family 3 protein [Aaosphaeria arxii CBS 175.79]KAF2014563.1 glycoside hydrolase family 3 protein [Aaosphaeria arxii CBS 175.79]
MSAGDSPASVASHTRISDILAALSLEEKLSLLAGASPWRTTAIKRVGVPPLKVSDGPSGARGEVFGENVPAAFLPSGVSLGATWDVNLMERIGGLLAEECKTKSASVSLAPTMCIHRHPLGGRNFESFSEDPFLTGKLASAHIRGMQSRGIGATPKHFVANDQETKRFKVSANISARALREVYLLPFQMMVREADPWCMMTAYNKVNGHHCDASKELLIDIARDEWKWSGVFMSDWGGTTSAVASINNGLDLEMPGPPQHRSLEALKGPLADGAVDLKRIDESAYRMLNLLERTGRFEDDSDEPEYTSNDPTIGALLLEAAAAGIVLLKNQPNALPLKADEQSISRLAVVGPNAKRIAWRVGVTGHGTEVVFHEGARMNRYLPAPSKSARNPDTGIHGACVDWFFGHDFSTGVVTKTHIDDLYFINFGDVPKEIGRPTDFCFRVRTVLTPLTTGTHKLSLASMGPAKLFVDGNQILQQSGDFSTRASLFFTYGSDEVVTELFMEAGKDHDIRIDYLSHDRQLDPSIAPLMDPMENIFQGVRLGFQEANDSDLPAEAGVLAKTCDAAIVVVGRDKEWETEGHDIPIFELPGEQVRLIREVAANCKRTIVVVQAGTPVNMYPWIDQVDAVLYTWYQGQELGNAAAQVITGKVNPSGRLPITFPRDLRDCPAYSSFPGEQNESHYSEGLYVGYRWWDLVGTKPLFPIGYGLSYNGFSISPAGIDSTTLTLEKGVTVTATVRNTGGYDVAGAQIVIFFAKQVSACRLARPTRHICGFAKTSRLTSGQEEVVSSVIDAYALGMFDASKKRWVIDAGSEFEIHVGSDAEHTECGWRITVPEEISWTHILGDGIGPEL